MDWLAGHVEAVEALGLRERSWITFQQPALIAEVRDLRGPMDTPPLFYVAVEVSHTGTSEHLFRVTDHSRIVTLVTGQDTYPVVASERLTDCMMSFVRDRIYEDVHQFVGTREPDDAYWYRTGPV